MNHKHVRVTQLFVLMLALLFSASMIQAQTTQFTYQGRLTDSSLPANGSYDFQFKLFDALSGGAQVGGTLSPTNVSVSNGIFTVALDFGSAVFPGANRWLDISVRLAGGGAFTQLTPRQPVTSTPYAIKSLSAAAADGLSATCNGCVTGTQIGSLPTGSGNYIQNSTVLQASSNFNISGNGLIGGQVGVGTTTLFDKHHVSGTGVVRSRVNSDTNAGFRLALNESPKWSLATVTGNDFLIFNETLATDAFHIASATNRVGVGTATPGAVLDVVGGSYSTGIRVTSNNIGGAGVTVKSTDVGGIEWNLLSTGTGNTGGVGNFGLYNNNVGAYRLFVTGGGNVGIGTSAPGAVLDVVGGTYSTGMRITSNNIGGAGVTVKSTDVGGIEWNLLSTGTGNVGGVGNFGLYNNSAAAYRMFVTGAGNVGIGTTSPSSRLHVVDSAGTSGTIQVGGTDTWSAGETRRIVFGDTGCAGPCAYVGEEDADDRLVLRGGKVRVKVGDLEPDSNGGQNLGALSNRWATVFAVNGVINTSDARLKKSVANLNYGLSQVMQLRPVSFQWKESTDGRNYLGFIAQEVEKVIPEAIEKSKDPATPMGMNYTSLVPVLIKAVQEQQATLEHKDAEIKAIRNENEALNARLAAVEQMMQQLKEQAEKQAQPKQQ